MNESLKKKLLEDFKLTLDQISKLEAAGVVVEDDLKMLTAADLKEAGLNIVTAKKLSAAFNPPPAALTPVAEAATAAPVSGANPMNITVRTGNPEDMTIQELLVSVSEGERSQDITSVLRRKVGPKRRVYVRKAGSDQLDVAATMEMINQDFPEGTEPAFWDSEPTETLTEILQMRTYADPLTGNPLAKGDPWLKLGDEKMAAFAYAKIKGNVLNGSEDKYTLTSEAMANPTGERWNKIQALWNRGIKSGDPAIMEARAAIIYRVSQGTNRRESEFRDRKRSGADVGGGQPGTGSSFRDDA